MIPTAPIYGSRGDVLFGNPEDANGTFSLASSTPITVGGLLYKTPEHCFQVRRERAECCSVERPWLSRAAWDLV